MEVREPAPEVVTKIRAPFDGPHRVAVTAIQTPDSEFADRAMVEVARGCTKGCRYCWVGYSILPFGHWAEKPPNLNEFISINEEA